MKIDLVAWYDIDMVVSNPTILFVFGDNMIRWGSAGQAVIRGCQNSFGIATKREPNNRDTSFFADRPDEYLMCISDISRLIEWTESTYSHIVFPKDGLGTGMSKMQYKSPHLFKTMNEILFHYFGVYGT